MKFNLIWGITTPMWARLLRENRYRIDPRAVPRVFAITAASLVNWTQCRQEERAFGRLVDAVRIEEPPIFVIGHWRTGTSHVQRLLAQDRRLSTPNVVQTMYPSTFLRMERTLNRWLGWTVPKTRMEDNMSLGFQVPSEDDVALSVLTLMSPYLLWSFPERLDHYLRYLTLADVGPQETQIWKRSLMRYLRKLTLKHRRRLVLKSPPYTCRLKLLLELFPEARFVHCRRNPYQVYQSMRHLYRRWRQGYATLGRWPAVDVKELILKTYRRMYDAYFEQVRSVPEGHLFEVRFEDLERDPIGEMCRLYRGLNLEGFRAAEERLGHYLRGISHYQKNCFQALDAEERRAVASQWERCFAAWDYPMA